MKGIAITATLTVSVLVACSAADPTTVLPGTAATAPLAGTPDTNPQGAPRGGSFPGSFLVPGTNTSIKIGG